ILMTSFAFIIGVLPLVVASGAGAEMRRSLGIAVFSGMLGGTQFGIFLTPVFFFVIQGLGEARLFARALTRLGAPAALGARGGVLLSRLGVVSLPWALGCGAVAGALAVIAVLGAHRQLWAVAVPSLAQRLKVGGFLGGRLK